MFNDLPNVRPHHELERHAYNAAFHELGLRWHWDPETYEQLMHRGADARQRIRFYLETRQPHLLKAYDADFLAAAIHDKQVQHAERCARSDGRLPGRCDWAQLAAQQVGA